MGVEVKAVQSQRTVEAADCFRNVGPAFVEESQLVMGARVGRIELQGPLQVRERPVGLIPGAVEGSKLQVGRDTFVALQRLSVMTLCFVQRITLRQDLAD